MPDILRHRRSGVPAGFLGRLGKAAAVVALAATLQGCAQIICRSGPLQSQLNTLNADIETTQGNVARGYAVHVTYEEYQRPVTVEEEVCDIYDDDNECVKSVKRLATEHRWASRRVERPVAIDIEAERAKLDYLVGRLEAIRGPAQQEFDACMASRR